MKPEIIFFSSSDPDKNGNGLQQRCAMWVFLLEKKGYKVAFKNYYLLSQNPHLLRFLKSLHTPVFIANFIHFIFTFQKRKKLLSTGLASNNDIFLFRINTLLNFSERQIKNFTSRTDRVLLLDFDECEYLINLSKPKYFFLNKVINSKVFSLENYIWKTPEILKFVSSKNELDNFNKLYGDSKNCTIEGNKIFPKINSLPEKTRNKTLELLVLGDYNYYPNEQMLHSLLTSLNHPALKNAEISFHVVGKGIKENISNLLSIHQSVTIHGYVSNEALFSLFLKVDFLFVPLYYGGGTKLKIIEALSFGLPSLSTDKATEGMNIKPFIHYIPYDKEDDFFILPSLSEREYFELRCRCFEVFNSQFALL